ncbi:hypothetical protein [Ralstonia phage RP31]|uniref:Uncharacterized protein n=1 Tax=Ralstonia phage RP31 TaxID=1923890 RepID=A0A1L7N1C8_9CAUD|nr:hypothetical protein [Ralstonia phage RP31]
MSEHTIVFTAKEIFQQIHRELIKLGVDTETIPLEVWNKYIIARAVEDVLLVDLTPEYEVGMESIAAIVRSNYRRSDGDDTFTIQEDVGSNKLFPYIGSGDLAFESNVELRRHCVIIGPRRKTG